ncbi:Tuberous sclerosis 2-like protein, partial [Dipsacomyces acuminosporus]
MSKDSPLADRLGALATLLPELKNKQLTNISSLWRSLTDIVRFAFGSDLPQAMHELQLSSSSCTSSTSTDSGLQTSARRLLLDLLVELSKNGHTQGGFDEDADEARQEMLHAISSASGWEETALAVRCVAWASCGARRLEGDPASWFKRAKEWSDQAIGQCYPEDNTSRDPLKEPPDDLCACMSASLDFLASIIREEYPVLDPDFVSETVANLCSKATHTRPVKENGTEKAAWVWTKHEHLFSVLKLLMALINFGALSQELLCPGILLLCTTVSVPMCNVLCCGIINRIFTSCYMRDGLLAMNCILHDDKSPQNSMHIYGKSDMTLHQDAIIGTVYFITKVMDTGLTDIQFRLRVGSFLPVLGKAAQCMHPEVLCLIFQYLCTIVDDARAKSMLPDDWHALIGILETTVGCRLAGVCDDHEHAPSAKLYSRALSSAIRFFRQRSTRASASLIGLIYRLRGVISDEIALRMLEFIDISGRPPPGAADWLAMLDEVMKLYYFDRARGIMLRRCAIRLCSKSFAEESAVSLSDIEHASFVLPMLEQLRMEVDGKLVEYALEILGPLLRHTRNPGILSKILQFSADAVLGVGCSWPIEQLSRPMSTDGNSQPAGKCECAGYMRIPCVVKCLLDAFEWHMHNTDSAGDEELALSHSMAIMLANTLLDLLESKHALLSVRCDILSVFLRLHADASSRLYILQTGRDTVMDQRIDIREKSYMKVATTKRVVLDNGSTQVVTVKFPVDRYVRILTGMLGSSLDPEMYYTLSQGLIPQLGNTYLFIACPGEIQELLARLIARYKLGPFGQEVHMHLSAEEKNKVSALSYGLLTSAVHYNSLLRRDQQDVLIAAFIDGLTVNSTTSTTPQICLHGLTVSILEMPNAVVRSLPHILHQLVMISSSPQISVHLLEFLSAISYEKTIYQTLRAEDYRAIFGVATSYIRFHNNKRRQLNASSTSSKRASLGSSSNNSNSPSTPTEPSISETALKQYVLVMAYQVIQVYFLSLSPNLRAATVSSILQRLLETNFNTESLDELNEVILDMILHNFNNPSSNLLNQELAVKEDLGSVAERTWIQHNSLVTIRAQRSGPLAQIIVRSPSAATSRVVDLPDEVARKYAERSKPATQSPPAGFASTSRSLAATPCSLSPSISTTNTHLQSIASTIPRGWAGHIAGRNHRLHPMAGPGSAGSLEANTLPSDAIAKLLCGELVTAQGSASRPVHFPIKFGPAPCVAQEFISAYPGLQNIDPPVLLPTESQAVS